MDQRTPAEPSIEAAIRDLESGKIKSVRAASKAHNVARSTLQGRVNGIRHIKAAHVREQRLTPTEEMIIIEWIMDLNAHGERPTLVATREMACTILRNNGDNKPLGANWVQKFIRRHPEISRRIGKKTNSETSPETNLETTNPEQNLEIEPIDIDTSFDTPSNAPEETPDHTPETNNSQSNTPLVWEINDQGRLTNFYTKSRVS